MLAIHCVLLEPQLALAHEYWIAPTKTSWQTGQMFHADIRNGENFTGTAYPFNPAALHSGGLVSDTARRPLSGRPGDYPAIQLKLGEPGLHLMLLETTARTLEHDTPAAFKAFLDYHALTQVVDQYESVNHARHKHEQLDDQHASQTENAATERYYRFVKSLFHVHEKQDRKTKPPFLVSLEKHKDSPALDTQGQLFELSISTAHSTTEELSLLLEFRDRPMKHRQVEILFKDASTQTVTRKVKNTDENGLATFRVSESGDYLFNSVWITPSAQTDVDWTSYWASLTLSLGADT